MKFEKGISGNPEGRKPGTQNQLTKTFKELLAKTIQDIEKDGGEHTLRQFAEKHPIDFWKIAARLIPTELTGGSGGAIQIIISKNEEGV